MERKIYGVFTAGGSGVRMGAQVPKQFLEIDGKPILQRTIERFLEAVPEMEGIVVLPKDHFSTWNELCMKNAFNVKQTLVAGGLTRFHSVQNALRKVPDGAVVAIQDGVRPFASIGFLRGMFSRMEDIPALIPVRPVTDTLKTLERDGNGVLRTSSVPDPDRSVIFGAQTPQIFHSEDLKEAYCTAFDVSFTDDASVFRKSGKPLAWCEGERFNIKITTPEDLKLSEALIAGRMI